MSRAFVKESDGPEPRCPTPDGCGGMGVSVAESTVHANLAPGDRPSFHGEAFYCPSPDCEIAYFDGFGTRIDRGRLLRRAFPKDTGEPVCACFGVAAEAIEEWAARGDKAAMKSFLARTSSTEARCGTTAPDGRCCSTEARRVFMRALGLPET